MVLAVTISCNSKKSQETSKPDSLIVNSFAGPVSSLEGQSPIFRTILKSDAGMARGISIGDLFQSTVQTEKAPLSETQPENGKGFTEYFDDSDLNFVDITYTKDQSDKVASITLDVYVERKSAVDSLFTEFKTYFSRKYGKNTVNGKGLVWKVQDNKSAVLQDVSTEKDPGIKILFVRENELKTVL